MASEAASGGECVVTFEQGHVELEVTSSLLEDPIVYAYPTSDTTGPFLEQLAADCGVASSSVVLVCSFRFCMSRRDATTSLKPRARHTTLMRHGPISMPRRTSAGQVWLQFFLASKFDFKFHLRFFRFF